MEVEGGGMLRAWIAEQVAVEVEGAQEVVDATTGVSGSMPVVGALRDVGEYGIVLEEHETAAGGRHVTRFYPWGAVRRITLGTNHSSTSVGG
jgi:hypothetical protein